MRVPLWLVASALVAETAFAQAPPKPIKGPAKPELLLGNRTFVAFGTKAAAARVAWSPVVGAARYRVRWIDGDKSYDFELTAATPLLERAESRAGSHRVQVVAIDDAGVESEPAETAIDIVSIEAISPGFSRSVPMPTAAFSIGARFRSPGLPCQLGDVRGAAGAEIVAMTPGAFRLRCGGEAGQPVAEVPLVIAPIVVAADTAPLRVGARAEVHITVASVAPIGDELTIVAIGELDVGTPERVEGGIDVRVTPRTGFVNPGTGSLVVRSGTTELGRITLDIEDAPSPPRPERVETEWLALDLGGFVSSLTIPHVGPSASFVGKGVDPEDFVANGVGMGLRLGLFPARRLGLEVEGAFVSATYAGKDGIAPLLVIRPQVAIRAVEDNQFGLRGLFGADLISTLDDRDTSRATTIAGVHYGAAFTIETRARVSVRFQALHIITPAQDSGYAHLFELGVGVSARFGRRDRWD